MQPIKTLIASGTLAATALAGGIVLGPTLAGAQDDTAPAPDDGIEAPARGDFVQDALAPLVTDGTITQAQADAVEEALATARESVDRPQGHRGPGHRGFRGGAVLEELGLDRGTVRDGLQSGLTLAEIAEANGVSTDALVDAMVAQAEERLATAVENGRLSAEEAEEKAAEIEERIEARING